MKRKEVVKEEEKEEEAEDEKKDQQKQTLQILDGFPRKRATTDGTPEIKQRQNRPESVAAVIRAAIAAAAAAAGSAEAARAAASAAGTGEVAAPATMTPILSSAFFQWPR